MARGTITIEDDPSTGQVTVGADFGAELDPKSQAHGMIYQLLQAVLGTAKTFTKVEDTVPELDPEPSRIITTEGSKDV